MLRLKFHLILQRDKDSITDIYSHVPFSLYGAPPPFFFFWLARTESAKSSCWKSLSTESVTTVSGLRTTKISFSG